MGLLQQLKDHAKTLIREEIELAKAEMSKKISTFARNSVGIDASASLHSQGRSLRPHSQNPMGVSPHLRSGGFSRTFSEA